MWVRRLISKGCRCIPTMIASVPSADCRKWAGFQVFPFRSSEGRNVQYQGGPCDWGNFQSPHREDSLFFPDLDPAVESEICQGEGKWGGEVMFGGNVTRNRSI